jgi:hypothetical protein
MYILVFPLSDERKPCKPVRIAVMWPTLVSDIHFATALPAFLARVKTKIYLQLFLRSKLNYPFCYQDNTVRLIFSIERQNSRKDIIFYLRALWMIFISIIFKNSLPKSQEIHTLNPHY